MRFQSGMLWVLQNLGILPSGWWGSPAWKFTITRMLSWELQHDTVRGCSLRIGVGHLISWVGCLIWGFRIDIYAGQLEVASWGSVSKLQTFIPDAVNALVNFAQSLMLKLSFAKQLRRRCRRLHGTTSYFVVGALLCYSTVDWLPFFCFFFCVLGLFNSSSMYNICGIWHCLNSMLFSWDGQQNFIKR